MSEFINRRAANLATVMKIIIIIQIVALVSSAAGQKWRTDQLFTISKPDNNVYPIGNEQQQLSSTNTGGQHDEEKRSSERIDKLANAIGDQIWLQQERQQRDLLQQNSQAKLDRQLFPPIGDQSNEQYRLLLNQQYQPIAGILLNRAVAPSTGASSYAMINGAGPRDYYDTPPTDEIKQSWTLLNPARENRAFKPKLMSTARGFGKRSVSANSGQRITYSDLVAMANANSPTPVDGKTIR